MDDGEKSWGVLVARSKWSEGRVKGGSLAVDFFFFNKKKKGVVFRY